MSNPATLITGANGEVGHGLIQALREKNTTIIALDLNDGDAELQAAVDEFIVGDINDTTLLTDIFNRYHFETIYHMAALLSTSAEKNPALAHRVNVDGTLNLMKMAMDQAMHQKDAPKFIFPSSIAVYGMPSVAEKEAAENVPESDYLDPITMYGVTKLHGEHLGRYFMNHYQQFEPNRKPLLDFRGVRFPGLISAHTVPAGGTSDYGPEMLHAAAQGNDYACFVRADSALPFMAMPDAIKSLLMLTEAPRTALSRNIYNVTSFSLSAEQIQKQVQLAFPDINVTYQPHAGRQQIVDSWPADLDDHAARQDWGWQPDYDVDAAFNDYLIPTISQRYKIQQNA